MLKAKELKRATLIEACINGQCTVKQVATILGLSDVFDILKVDQKTIDYN